MMSLLHNPRSLIACFALLLLPAGCLTGNSNVEPAHTVHLTLDYDGNHIETDALFSDLDFDDRDHGDSSCSFFSGNCGSDAWESGKLKSTQWISGISLSGISRDTARYQVGIRRTSEDPYKTESLEAKAAIVYAYPSDFGTTLHCFYTELPCTMMLTRK